MTYTSFDEATEAIEAAESDIRADLEYDGRAEAVDSAVHEFIVAFALHDCDRATGDEVLRCHAGITRREAERWL